MGSIRKKESTERRRPRAEIPTAGAQHSVECDADLFGSEAEEKRRYAKRYLLAQALYRAEIDPEVVADVVVDNAEPARPVVLRWSASTDP